jgi:hypothetical protein
MNMIQEFLLQHFMAVAVGVIVLIAWNPKRIYTIFLLQKKLDAREALPDCISKFPIHDTTLQKYLDVKLRIDEFKRLVLSGEFASISLSAADINDAYLQGSNIDKYKFDVFAPFPFMKYSNKFMFFEIFDNKILKREIEYITLDGWNGVITETIEISYKNLNNALLVRKEYIERNGRNVRGEDKSREEFYAIDGCTFLEGLLRCSFEPQGYQRMQQNENKLIQKIVGDLITSVEITDDLCIIEFDPA